jgi:protein SCO1/2
VRRAAGIAALVVVVVVVAGVIGVQILGGVRRGLAAATTPAEFYVSSRARPPGSPLPTLFAAPAFELPESRGGQVSRDGLRGTVWISNFLFTQCTSVCPVMSARMVQLQRRLTSPHVRFVSFSVDPDHDTPAVLRGYAAHWRPEPRWLLLSTTPAALDAVARGLRVAVAPSDDAADPIVHSRLVTLIDADGQVRGIYDSDDEVAWQRLAHDAEELLGAPSALAAATVADRSSPLVRFGCTGCHDRAAVAPPLTGLGHEVALVTGETVTADAGYLREALVAPGARVVAGYAPTMPSYRVTLSAAELDEVLAAVAALPSTPAARAVGGAAEDPICHMAVATVDPALTVREGDHDVHFCSARCRHAYLAAHPR